MNRLMIIPAAGLGTRLASPLPKVLFKVNERPMIDYLFDLYKSIIDKFVIVLHPSFADEVRAYCNNHQVRVEFVIQMIPTGMLDAILLVRDTVEREQPEHIWITWCDQIGVQPRTVSALKNLTAQQPAAAMTFPTILRKQPYIHFVRNENDRIIGILQRREGDDMPEPGENDVGLFSLSLCTYLEQLTEFAQHEEVGIQTGERNFLPFIPWLSARKRVLTLDAVQVSESMGINSQQDVRNLAPHLNKL